MQVMLHGGIQGRALQCGAVGWAGGRVKEGGKIRDHPYKSLLLKQRGRAGVFRLK